MTGVIYDPHLPGGGEAIVLSAAVTIDAAVHFTGRHDFPIGTVFRPEPIAGIQKVPLGTLFLLLSGILDHGLVILRVDIRQGSHKSDNGPDLFVGMDFLEGGHAGHL